MPKGKHIGQGLIDAARGKKGKTHNPFKVIKTALNSESVKDALKNEREHAPGLNTTAAADFKTLNDTLSTFKNNELATSTKALNETIEKLRAEYQDLPEVLAQLEAVTKEIKALNDKVNTQLATAEKNSKDVIANHHIVMTIHDKQSGQTNTEDKATGRTAFANLQANATALKTAATSVDADVKTFKDALNTAKTKLAELAEKGLCLRTIKQICKNLETQSKTLTQDFKDFKQEFEALKLARQGDEKAVSELQNLECVSKVQGTQIAFQRVVLLPEKTPDELKGLLELKASLETMQAEAQKVFASFKAELKTWREFVAKATAPSEDGLQTEEELLAAQAMETMRRLAAVRAARSNAGASSLSGTGASFTPQATAQATAAAPGNVAAPTTQPEERKRSTVTN